MKTLQIRISDEDKKAADNVLAQIGLDMPTAIRLYLKKIVITKSIPFELNAASFQENFTSAVVDVDPQTQQLMDNAVNQWNKRKKK